MERPIREEPLDQSSPPAPLLDGQLHLLGEDDVSGYRRRESTWLSLAIHAALILLLIFLPKWTPSSPVLVPVQPKQDAIFLDAPETKIKVKPPQTNILSDQNRVAQAPTPLPDRRTLRDLIDARRAGQPKPPAQAQAAPPAVQPPQAAAPAAPAQPQPAQQAKLEAPAAPRPLMNPFAIRSAGSAVDQAIRAVANGHIPHPTTDSDTGDYGSGLHPRVDNRGDMEILSDTMGVDFGPYMKRLHVTVQNHWDPLIPEAAEPPIMEKGVVVIQFDIMKDGRIAGIQMVKSSGDKALDDAAWGALSSSNPLPVLPVAYTKDYLIVRAVFYYNPDQNAFE